MKLKHVINTGDRFGRLLVIEQMPNNRWGNRVFLCRCDCGNERTYQAGALYQGRAQSCGCLHRERVTRHGDSLTVKTRTPLYKKWRGIKIRCNHQTAQAYRYYGARGITYCKEWEDFRNFKAWALSSGYQEGLEIDRIDPDGNYEPANCRWVTRKEQHYNKRNTLRYNGEPLKIVCQKFGVDYGRVWKRIYRDGWSAEKALFVPVKPYKRKES